MQINDYQFGNIRIDGTAYTTDVVFSGEGMIDPVWWRKQGHSLDIDDLQQVVDYRPEVLVVGTGYYGRLQVGEEIRSYLSAQGIKLITGRTTDAVAQFNQLQQKCARIVAALHLTC